MYESNFCEIPALLLPECVKLWLGEHRFRKWLGALQHEVIIKTNADLLIGSIALRRKKIKKMHVKITSAKCHFIQAKSAGMTLNIDG